MLYVQTITWYWHFYDRRVKIGISIQLRENGLKNILLANWYLLKIFCQLKTKNKCVFAIFKCRVAPLKKIETGKYERKEVHEMTCVVALLLKMNFMSF